jgi:hypothetical protein
MFNANFGFCKSSGSLAIFDAIRRASFYRKIR